MYLQCKFCENPPSSFWDSARRRFFERINNTDISTCVIKTSTTKYILIVSPMNISNDKVAKPLDKDYLIDWSCTAFICESLSSIMNISLCSQLLNGLSVYVWSLLWIKNNCFICQLIITINKYNISLSSP